MSLLQRLGLGGRISLSIGLMGLVTLASLGIALMQLREYDRTLAAVKNAGERAAIAERLNGLVYAVVMDSRGVYMAANAERAKPFSDGIRRFLGGIERDVAAWEALLPADQRASFAPLKQGAADFIRLRSELARLGTEVSIAEANRIGNNDDNRRNRSAFNAAIDSAAKNTAEQMASLAARETMEEERLAEVAAREARTNAVQAETARLAEASSGVMASITEAAAQFGAAVTGMRAVAEATASGWRRWPVPRAAPPPISRRWQRPRRNSRPASARSPARCRMRRASPAGRCRGRELRRRLDGLGADAGRNRNLPGATQGCLSDAPRAGTGDTRRNGMRAGGT